MFQKFNNIYNLIIENINPTLVDTAIKICNDPEKNKNLYIKTLENQFDKIVKNIIDSEKFLDTEKYSQHFSIRKSIQQMMIDKGFMKVATGTVGNLTNIYKNDALLLAQDMNTKEPNFNQVYIYDKLSNAFIQRLFNYKKLNKTISTANIGRGQLLLCLILKNAYFNGIDDLTINGKNYNVKYINILRKNKNALIIHRDIDNSFNQFNTLINKYNSENKSEIKIDNYINDNIQKNIFLSDLKKYLQLITRSVYGYILVTDFYDDSGKFNLQFIKITKEQILKYPQIYLYSIKHNNMIPGLYFRGNILFSNNKKII